MTERATSKRPPHTHSKTPHEETKCMREQFHPEMLPFGENKFCKKSRREQIDKSMHLHSHNLPDGYCCASDSRHGLGTVDPPPSNMAICSGVGQGNAATEAAPLQLTGLRPACCCGPAAADFGGALTAAAAAALAAICGAAATAAAAGDAAAATAAAAGAGVVAAGGPGGLCFLGTQQLTQNWIPLRSMSLRLPSCITPILSARRYQYSYKAVITRSAWRH